MGELLKVTENNEYIFIKDVLTTEHGVFYVFYYLDEPNNLIHWSKGTFEFYTKKLKMRKR